MTFTEGTGGVMHPIGLQGFMEIYKIDTTFQAQTPDDLDPGRTKPDMPSAWKVSDNAGCRNPIIARVFIQCAEALGDKTLRRGAGEKIRKSLHDTKTEVRNCEKCFRRLAAEYDRITQIIKGGGIRAEKGVVPNLPQIPNLHEDATLFITSTKHALEHIAEVLNQFYGTTISNARFDKGLTQLKALQPVPAEQLACLDFFALSIERVMKLRNFLDHIPRKTLFEDFRLEAGTIQPPSWRVDPEPAAPMLSEMPGIIAGLIELAEVSFFHGLMDNLDCPPGPFGYCLEEIPEAARDQDCPVRFRCGLSFA